MDTKPLRKNMEQVVSSVNLYSRLSDKVLKTDVDVSNTKMKMKYIKEFILKSVLRNKKIIKKMDRGLEI